MEPNNEFEFNYDEKYENEMVIQWKNGEKAKSEIDLQRRIQERMQREKTAGEAKDNEAKIQPRKPTPLKVKSKFEGFRQSDFKNSAAGTIWRGRTASVRRLHCGIRQ